MNDANALYGGSGGDLPAILAKNARLRKATNWFMGVVFGAYVVVTAYAVYKVAAITNFFG